MWTTTKKNKERINTLFTCFFLHSHFIFVQLKLKIFTFIVLFDRISDLPIFSALVLSTLGLINICCTTLNGLSKIDSLATDVY